MKAEHVFFYEFSLKKKYDFQILITRYNLYICLSCMRYLKEIQLSLLPFFSKFRPPVLPGIVRVIYFSNTLHIYNFIYESLHNYVALIYTKFH